MNSRHTKDDASAGTERQGDDPLRVSATRLASIMGVSRTAVMKWVDDEGAPCESRGTKGLPAQFFLPTFMAWWTERARRKGASETGAKKLSERKAQLELDMLELKYRREAREVIPRVVLVQVVRDVSTRVQTRLRQLPGNEAHSFVRLQTPEEAESMLRATVEAVATECRRSDFWRPVFGTAELFSDPDAL